MSYQFGISELHRNIKRGFKLKNKHYLIEAIFAEFSLFYHVDDSGSGWYFYNDVEYALYLLKYM